MKKNSFGANSVLSDIYSDTAGFGRDYAYVVSAFVIIICILAIIIGLYFIQRKPVYTTQVDFTITKVTPQSITVNQGTNKPPLTTTIYNLEGTVQICGKSVIVLPGYPRPVNVGETVKVWMKPNCQSNEAHYSSDDTVFLGWVIISIAFIFIIVNILRLFFVKRYKGAAALQGAAGISNIFKMFTN